MTLFKIIKHLKCFCVKNSRDESQFSDGVEFTPSDIPNAPLLKSVVESDRTLSLSWDKPNDYASWFVESYNSIVHIDYKNVLTSVW